MIDADASPCGYIAWHNHYTGYSRIRAVRPVSKNERFGVQRMEMLAIYFVLADNIRNIKKKISTRKNGRTVIAVRSDSKSTVEHLRDMCHIRDSVMRRLVLSIAKLLANFAQIVIVFSHLDRSRNIAGLLLEWRKANEQKYIMMGDFNTATTTATIPAILYT